MNNCPGDNGTVNQYRDPAAYPPIQVQRPDSCYASILMQDYASGASELTAITQYLHHSLTQTACDEVRQTLLGIAQVEMDHLRTLGATIVLLGGDPKFASGCPLEFWSGEQVSYGRNLCEQLRADLSAEQGAIRQYQRHIRQIDDPCVQAILKRIVLDEQWHERLLNRLIGRFCDPQPCPVTMC